MIEQNAGKPIGLENHRLFSDPARIRALGPLRARLKTVDLPTRTHLYDQLEASFSGADGAGRLAIVDALFYMPSTRAFKERVTKAVPLGQIPELIRDEGLATLTSVMAERPDTFRFPLGVLLSYSNNETIPDEILQKIQGRRSTADFRVLESYRDWALCGSTEERMKMSVDEQSALVIDDNDGPYIVVKPRGIFVGLAIETVATNNGTLVEGNFYTFTDTVVRRKIREAMANRKGRLTITDKDVVMLRPIRDLRWKMPDTTIKLFSQVEQITAIKQAASTIPPEYDSDYIFNNKGSRIRRDSIASLEPLNRV